MKIEPLTQRMLNGLKAALTPIQVAVSGLHNVDLAKGRGVLDETGRRHCMWTMDGRRITVIVEADGGIIVGQSKEEDPEMPT